MVPSILEISSSIVLFERNRLLKKSTEQTIIKIIGKNKQVVIDFWIKEKFIVNWRKTGEYLMIFILL